MPEPTMYPSTMFPTAEANHADFAELRTAIEQFAEDMFAVLSWHLYAPAEDPEPGSPYPREFVLLLFEAPRGQTIQFRTHDFDADEVEAWLDGYVRSRVLRWYGWTVTPGRD